MTFKCVHTVVHAYVNATEARACATKSVVLKIQQSSKRYGHYFEKKEVGSGDSKWNAKVNVFKLAGYF